ncbi:hypothetical protein T12_4957, partial [Trichinella patagoniensis]
LSDPVVSFILFDTFGTLNAEADSFSLVKASSVLLVSADRFISHLANVSGFVLTFDDDDEIQFLKTTSVDTASFTTEWNSTIFMPNLVIAHLGGPNVTKVKMMNISKELKTIVYIYKKWEMEMVCVNVMPANADDVIIGIIQEKTVLTLEMVIGGIGGQVGLWLGCSLMSFVHLLVYLLQFCFHIRKDVGHNLNTHFSQARSSFKSLRHFRTMYDVYCKNAGIICDACGIVDVWPDLYCGGIIRNTGHSTDVPPWQPRNPFLCQNEGTLTHMVLFQRLEDNRRYSLLGSSYPWRLFPDLLDVTDTERDEASQSGNRINEVDVGEADFHDRVRQIKNKYDLQKAPKHLLAL